MAVAFRVIYVSMRIRFVIRGVVSASMGISIRIPCVCQRLVWANRVVLVSCVSIWALSVYPGDVAATNYITKRTAFASRVESTTRRV